MIGDRDYTYTLPSWKDVKLGLRLLDRIRYVGEAQSYDQIVDFVNSSRTKNRRKWEPLPSNVHIPLATEPFWKYLLKLAGPLNKQSPPSVKRLSLKSTQCVVHLLEYLELCYLVHETPYEKINATFLHYGQIINKRHNPRRNEILQMDDRFWTYQFRMHDLQHAVQRPFGERTSPMSLAILEWTIISIQKNEERAALSSRVHIASIRSVFIESKPEILRYMWPSLVHFQSFPKDKDTYIIPLLPWIRSGRSPSPPSLCHATLAIATVANGRETGTLQLYDASYNVVNQTNLESILDRLNQCQVGGVKRWKLPASKKTVFYPGPKQTHNMCVVACCCLCLWMSGTRGFEEWGDKRKLRTWSADWWWGYRIKVCQMVKEYVEGLETAGFISWMNDETTGSQFTDPSLHYRFRSILPRKPFVC
jgi:hypothetical protein